jgi:hypothetical protein
MSFGDPNPYKGFDQLKELGLPGANAKYFPYILDMTVPGRGGMKQMGPLQQSLTRMLRTTANASLTWIRSNHSYKFGGEMRLEGYPATLESPAYGTYVFNEQQTGLAIEGLNTQGLHRVPVREFLGLVNNDISYQILLGNRPGIFARIAGKHAQIHLDYGLRRNRTTCGRWGRVANFATARTLLQEECTAVILKAQPGHCNCDLVYHTPSPRLGLLIRSPQRR